MKASYKKLWKLLVDKEMSKGDLHKASGLSSSTMTKLRKGEDVSMEALRKSAFASTVISVTLWSLWTKTNRTRFMEHKCKYNQKGKSICQICR